MTIMVRMCKPESALGKEILLEVEGGLGEVGGPAEVAPIVLVGGEGEDFLTKPGQAEVGVNDREDAVFREKGEEARGEDVDAGEGKRVERAFKG